jgi:hypothetical protein
MKFHRTILAALVLATFSALTLSQEARDRPAETPFKRFPARVYSGPVKLPKGLHRDTDGAWRDDLDKWVDEPRVNFAGEYFLAGHSCGTCCRYYTLHNLRTGLEFNAISMFNAGDTPPRTRDGHTYVPILSFRPNSRLLIVQYDLDPCMPAETGQCRERYFVFDGGRFKAISKTHSRCTQEGRNPNK